MNIYRDPIELVKVELDDKSVFKHAIMSDEVCQLDFTIEQYYIFDIGDYIIYNNQKFTINTPPSCSKIANNEYQYKLRFEGVKYDLGKILFKLDGATEFALNSNISQIVDLIVINMNENSDITWSKGVCSITPYFDFTLSNENCLEVLNKACVGFEVEFEVIQNESGYVINVRDSIGIYQGLALAYKLGIYQLSQEPASNDNVITKLYAYGASKNIPANYGYSRIKIAPLLNNEDIYGISEKTIVFDDIYPKFSGNVSYANNNYFRDNYLNFNINDYLIPGISAKIRFLSGNLSGYEFEIVSFDNSTKEFELATLKDDIGQVLPNNSLPISVSDRYTITDIYMPQSYIDAAETELLNRAQNYLAKYSNPLYKYSLTIDVRYLRDNNISLYAGEKIRLMDIDMGIDKQLRIYTITQSLANPFKYDIELTDELMMSRMIKLIYGQYDINRRLEQLKKEVKILKNN